eukprot:COSAG06_NODE_423_length_15942_cov_7.276463_11_plen_64_part_00
MVACPMEQQHAQQHHVAGLEHSREQPHAMLPRKLDRMQPVLASQTVRAARSRGRFKMPIQNAN